jgi:hypothetical protein
MTSTFAHFIFHDLIILTKLSDNANVEECYLLGCDSAYYSNNMPNFQGVLLPASSFVKYHEDGSSKPH